MTATLDSDYHNGMAMTHSKQNETTQAEPQPPRRRRSTKREMARRDLRLIEKLAAGATIEEIAASEGISAKWARERKATILARGAVDRPHEFIQLQIRRLSEAMLVAYSAMSLGDLKAVDKVIKVARELDRYHGFGPYPNAQRLAAPLPTEPPPPLALPGPALALAPPETQEAAAGAGIERRGDPKPGADEAVLE
jgi:DNA-binding Lrp family transcriptional regulator